MLEICSTRHTAVRARQRGSVTLSTTPHATHRGVPHVLAATPYDTRHMGLGLPDDYAACRWRAVHTVCRSSDWPTFHTSRCDAT
jgi:hypothetical protein